MARPRTRQTDRSGADVISAPVPFLDDLNIVDTPGTNAIFREHERLTSEFVPQADLVLFVTSADRPFTESERIFLEQIKDWGKKIVVVINKIDLLEERGARAGVRFVADHARPLFGSDAGDLSGLVPSRAAAQVSASRHEAVRGDHFAELEHYIGDDARREGAAAAEAPESDRHRHARWSRRPRHDQGPPRCARADLQTIDDIERQLDVYRADLSREFEFRLSEVDNILQQFENRGMAFFDETLRVGRIPDLLNKARIQREFERTVVADVPQQIEKQVHDVIDWMVASELRQWQAVTEHVNRRAKAHEGRVMGGETSGFQYDRQKLINTVGRAANTAVDSYDREREAAAMADGVRTAVAGAALAQAGAVGLGAVVAAVATTTAADVTGIVAAGTIAVLGMFVIPSKRKQAKAQLRARIERMRTELMTDLRAQFEREVDRSVRGVIDAVAPYTRFVRAEHEKLTGIDRELEEIGGRCHRFDTRSIARHDVRWRSRRPVPGELMKWPWHRSQPSAIRWSQTARFRRLRRRLELQVVRQVDDRPDQRFVLAPARPMTNDWSIFSS